MMQQFFDAMNEKFLLRARGVCKHCAGRGEVQDRATRHTMCPACNGTGHQNRSLEPWKDYSVRALWDRLLEEWNELDDASYDSRALGYRSLSDEAAAELLDVANLACFLWLKWKIESELKAKEVD